MQLSNQMVRLRLALQIGGRESGDLLGERRPRFAELQMVFLEDFFQEEPIRMTSFYWKENRIVFIERELFPREAEFKTRNSES